MQQHHGAILHNVEGCIDIISNDFGWDDEVFLSFLPASHAYEHTGGQHFPVALGAQIYYAESLEKLAANIEEVRPTIMVVVPRLFEMLRARIMKTIEKDGGLPDYLMDRALAIGAKRYAGKSQAVGPADGRHPVADPAQEGPRQVRRADEGDGVGRRAAQSRRRPVLPVARADLAPGLWPDRGRAGDQLQPAQGRASGWKRSARRCKNTEVRIAEDGEIMVRGENVMHGYWRNPEETARVLHDGWLATGDVGHLDEKGRIVITDRKKDLIVNDKGDNVSPQRVEGMLTLQPEIAQAMVYGDRRPTSSRLLVPGAGISPTRPTCSSGCGQAVDRVNAELSVIEKVRRFILADAAVHGRERATDAVDEDPPPRHPRRLWRAAGRALQDS